jgi:hypothetical protein
VLWHFAEKINNKHHMIKSMTVAPRRAVIFSPSTQVIDKQILRVS